MSVGEMCSREVIVTDRNDSIVHVAQLMREHHVGDVIVVEERNGEPVPAGIVTDRDIVIELVAEGVDLESVTIEDMMGSELLIAGEGDDLNDTIKHMRDRGVRRVPVVNHRGGLAGILAIDDVIDLIAEQLTDVDKLIGREQKHERETRGVMC